MQGHRNKNLIRILAIIIIIIAIAIGAFLIVKSNNSSTENLIEDDESILASETEEEKEAILTNGIDAYIRWIDERIQNASSDKERIELYHERAWELFNDENTEESHKAIILSDVYAAEALLPSATTARQIATFEELIGNPTTAIKYRDIARERQYNESREEHQDE